MPKYVFCFIILICMTIVVNSQATDTIFDKYNNQNLGLYAPDFRFVCIDKEDTLSLYNLSCDSLMILFYDPYCSHCKKEIKNLRKNKNLQRNIAENKITVLTIPPDITINEWKQYIQNLPKNWINAYCLDNDLIINKYLWKVPEMFVLDKNKRIIYINMYKNEYDEE